MVTVMCCVVATAFVLMMFSSEPRVCGFLHPREEPQHAVKENGASGVVAERRHPWRRCDSRPVLAQPRQRLPVPWRRVRTNGGDDA
jgi:hypothetical protein